MNTGNKIVLAAGLAGVALIAGLFLAFRSKPGRPGGFGVLINGFAVVELFTSEGCSSCPPAEALVATVQQEDKGLPVYILAFHVDYWDRLGWKDSFSAGAYSDRQKDYARRLGLASIYTPQVIVNGRREFVGSDAGALRQSISSSLKQEPAARISLGSQQLKSGRFGWQAHVEGVEGSDWQVVATVVEHDATTRVRAGENSGKTLSHVQIVRAIGTVRPDSKGNAGGSLDWPADIKPSQAEVIAFLQNQRDGRIAAATRSAIKE